jgi:hypothetical protein
LDTADRRELRELTRFGEVGVSRVGEEEEGVVERKEEGKFGVEGEMVEGEAQNPLSSLSLLSPIKDGITARGDGGSCLPDPVAKVGSAGAGVDPPPRTTFLNDDWNVY